MGTNCRFDQNGYWINGEPVWLASGEFQYFRLTKGEWRKRLLQMKAAGFNTISAYIAWNYHEVTEGNWDFSGNKDVESLLQMAAELEMFVIARPGPYICDEWECGGIPAWLSMRPGIRLRTADPQYLEYCDKWWDKIGPIIAKYQIGQGGTVILVQMENEYGHGGEHQEADYIYHLRDRMRSYGVTVPMINCDSFIVFDRLKPTKWEDINLCVNVGGDGLRVLDRARKISPKAPLVVTEYWVTPFDYWGKPEPEITDDKQSLSGALEMAAGGAGGITLFVFTGGSSFAYWNGRSICSFENYLTTHYGGGAPIQDDGRFTPKYNMFKREFTGLMSASKELAQAGMPEITGDMDGLVKAVRKGPNATFSFYINHSKEQMQLADAKKQQAAIDFAIPSGDVYWTVENLPLKSGFILNSTTGRLFAADPALVLYGNKGETIAVSLTDPDTGKIYEAEAVVPADGRPAVQEIAGADKKLTVLVIAEEDKNKKESKYRDLTLGLLDLCVSLLLFLPLFAVRADDVIYNVSLIMLSGVQPYVKVVGFAVVTCLILVGILILALQNCEARSWRKIKTILSLSLSVAAVLFFIMSLQPYAAVFAFVLLAIKVLVLIKSR